MTGTVGDYRAGVAVGASFGAAIVVALWSAAAGARRRRAQIRVRARIDTLARIHQRGVRR